MVLKQEVSFNFVAEAGGVLEFAFCDGSFYRFAAAFILQHLCAVDPMLDVVAFDDYSRLIDFARRLGGAVRSRQ